MRSTRVTFFSTLAITLVAFGAYGWWYYAVGQASATASSLLAQITIQGQTKDRVALARKALVDLESQEQQVNSYFVGQSDVVPFLEQLQAIGTNLNTKVTVASVSASTDPVNPTLTVVLGIHGAFDRVMRAVGAIENAPYDILVTSLTLNGTAKDGWDANMTFIVGSGSAPASSTTPAVAP